MSKIALKLRATDRSYLSKISLKSRARDRHLSEKGWLSTSTHKKSGNLLLKYFLAVSKLLEYSDYLESFSKEDPLYEYNNSKETMRNILTDFHKNCRLRLENLKAKHRRELRLLARLKQEQAEKGDGEALNGNVQKNVFGFPIRRSIVRYVNGVVP